MGDTVFNCLSHFCGCTVSGDMDRSGALTLQGGRRVAKMIVGCSI